MPDDTSIADPAAQDPPAVLAARALGLDVRVIDQMGLAYPLAAHTERLTDGRIGHDKNLPTAWVIAETGGVSGGPGLPG